VGRKLSFGIMTGAPDPRMHVPGMDTNWLGPQRIVINPHTDQIKKADANHCGYNPNEEPLRYFVKLALGLFFPVTHLPPLVEAKK
jgi:hypothetical protein